MLLRVVLCVFLSLLLNACGKSHVVTIKDFRLFVDSRDPVMQDAVAELVDRFNQDYGREILKLVDDQALSNSTIRFQDGLREEGRKLGLGQWVTTTYQQSEMSLQGHNTTTRVEFGMELAFDTNNFRSRAPYTSDFESPEAQHLYHLFCHEVGHGMQLDHTDSRNDVMFPSIPDQPNRVIDYETYFQQVKSFIGDEIAPTKRDAPTVPQRRSHDGHLHNHAE